MDSDNKQNNGSRLAWFGFGFIVIVLGTVAAFVLWPQLLLKMPSDVVVIKAVEGPIRIKPENSGGMAVPHQGLQVVTILENGSADDADVEILRPSASAPEPPPIFGDKIDTANTDSLQNKMVSPLSNADVNQSVVGDIARQDQRAANSKFDNTSEDVKPKKREEIGIKPIAKPTSEVDDGPFFVIQLAAFRSVERAKEIASLLSKKHQARLQGLQLKTMKLDAGNSGVFFRVVSVPMARVDAESACSKLRLAGQDCFLRKFLPSETQN